MINRAFTLIEVLVSVAIVAILSIIVVFVLNPQEMLKQSRDSNRLNDISNVSRALNYIIASEPNSFLGLPNTIYISLPDPSLSGNQTSTCSNMNLPPLPSGYNYYCVSSENLVKNDGTGWIPVNFSQQPVFKIAKLPIDPKNDINNYYVYIYDPSNNSYEFNANLESNKYNHLLAEDSGDSNFLYEIGSKLTLYPLSGIGQSMALKNESNQVIKSDQNFGIYIAQAASQGQIPFFVAADQVSGDNALFWDNTNKRLGIGTTAPTKTFHSVGDFLIERTDGADAFMYNNQANVITLAADTIRPNNDLQTSLGVNIVRYSSLWVNGLSVTGGKVGIGTTTPNSILSIIGGNIAIDNTKRIGVSPESIAGSGFYGLEFNNNDFRIYPRSTTDRYFNFSHDGSLYLYGNANSTYFGHKTGSSLKGFIGFPQSGGIQLNLAGGSNTVMQINTSGDVGIGTTTPAYKLDVFGDIRTTGCLVYNGGTLGTCVSEAELKNIIIPFQIEGALDKIVKLQPVKYSFKSDPSGQILIGLIAQDTEKILPELIETTLDGKKQIKYGELQWLQLEAIKELQNKINKLENENQDLKTRLQQLENKLQ